MMKKVFLAACVAALATWGAEAQTTIKPRVELGLNFGRVDVKHTELEFNIASGLRLSAAAEIMLSESLSTDVFLAPGISYKNHGAVVKTWNTNDRLSMNSLSLPVNLGLRAKLGNGLGVSFEFGPYFSYLLSANYQTQSQLDEYKRFDAGINASAALEYDRYFVRLGAEYGLTDLNKEKIENNYFRNMGVFTTVGLRF